MSILNPTQLETVDYGTQGFNDIYSTNFQKLNDYLSKFEDLWNDSAEDWNILRYDSSSGKWIKDTTANLGVQLNDSLAKNDLSNVDDQVILDKLKNVDGDGSGLDADLLDGNDSSYYTDSSNIQYDNSSSGLSSTNVKSAIDELDSNLDSHLSDTSNPHNVIANQIDYDNSSSGLSSTNVQDAIDEVESKIDSIEDGTITVGNADKLDNKEASDFANVDLSNVNSSDVLDKQRNILTKTEDYTTSGDKDEIILADASSNSITITLTTSENVIAIIKKIDNSANSVTITPDSGTIDGENSVSLDSQYEVVRLACDGTNWWKI